MTTRDPYVDPTGHLGPWRPLLFTVITGLITLTWNHFWIAHLVGAFLHAANTLVLFVILRKFGRSIHASAAACVLFLCWAVHNEAYLWASAFGSVTSALLFQFIVLCMVYFAKGGGWGWVFPIVFLTALILGFNEQASGALAALPLAYWAVCPDAQTTRERMKRAIIPTIAACTLIPIYVYLVRRYSPPGLGVEAESYVTLREFPDRMVAVAKDMLRNITLREFWYPAFALGWREWTAKNWLSGACGPRGSHLIAIIGQSDEALDSVLSQAGRRPALIAEQLFAARAKLVAAIGQIDDIVGPGA